ncbi:MAG: branched-chain amino acid ABC transporter permease [Dethiobacteria bacterium]|nr:branched-chain amino acid ABC transporter permease [Bacillota bacterium]HOP69287.1 branched-chain amino acid ABC transporter permease [Bacillota bacterium]HPT34263.1 branched-chain amino acid ABC transporter permease [Bacillota bacterium]HQD05427.1 branched-chain amino acid ABC transporter permease [Bacillota bacterium]
MFVQQLMNGLILGSTYALIALGYTMVYGIIELINFAHGEIYMFGAFVGLILVTVLKVPFFLAFLLAMAASALLGITIEYLAYRPLRRSSRLAALISAIGASIFLSNLALLIMGSTPYNFPTPFEAKVYETPFFIISRVEILVLLSSLLLMIALTLIVQKTKIGKAMRAVAQDKDTASLMGININKIVTITFAIGSALGGAAGVMVGIYFRTVTPTMGLMPGLKGFVAAVVGGIGNIPGAMLGGILLGIAEVLGAAYISSQYRDAVAFALLILVLLLKPSGLLGKPVQEKV